MLAIKCVVRVWLVDVRVWLVDVRVWLVYVRVWLVYLVTVFSNYLRAVMDGRILHCQTSAIEER
jgi:hypothetical protein